MTRIDVRLRMVMLDVIKLFPLKIQQKLSIMQQSGVPSAGRYGEAGWPVTRVTARPGSNECEIVWIAT